MPVKATVPKTTTNKNYTSRLKGELLALRHALELDEVVVRPISRQHRACVLEVLAFCLALERLLARVEEPIGQ